MVVLLNELDYLNSFNHFWNNAHIECLHGILFDVQTLCIPVHFRLLRRSMALNIYISTKLYIYHWKLGAHLCNKLYTSG